MALYKCAFNVNINLRLDEVVQSYFQQCSCNTLA